MKLAIAIAAAKVFSPRLSPRPRFFAAMPSSQVCILSALPFPLCVLSGRLMRTFAWLSFDLRRPRLQSEAKGLGF
jgi:hypothetical protein